MLLRKVFDEPFEREQRFWLEFSLPEAGESLAARGQLLWQALDQRYHLIAVRFRTLAPSHRREIERFVLRRTLQAHISPTSPVSIA